MDLPSTSTVDIAPLVLIATWTQELSTDRDRPASTGRSLPNVIEEGIWRGAAPVLLRGVSIGCRTMVVAGALVNNDVAPGCVVAGVPATVIRRSPEQ